MDDFEADDIIEAIAEMQRTIKALTKRVRRLERDADFDSDFEMPDVDEG